MVDAGQYWPSVLFQGFPARPGQEAQGAVQMRPLDFCVNTGFKFPDSDYAPEVIESTLEFVHTPVAGNRSLPMH